MALFDVNTPDTQFYQTPKYAEGLEADKLRLMGYRPDGSKNTFGKVMSWVNPLGSVIGNKVAQGYAQRHDLDTVKGNIQDGFANDMAKLDAIVGVGRVAAGDLTGIGQVAGAGSALIAGSGGPNYNNDGDIVRTKTLAEGGIVTDGSAPTMYPEGSKQEDATVIDDETGEPLAKMRKGEMVVSQQTTMNLDAMVEAYNNSPKRKRETIAKAIGELMVAEVAQHEQSEQEQSAQEPQMFYKGGTLGDGKEAKDAKGNMYDKNKDGSYTKRGSEQKYEWSPRYRKFLKIENVPNDGILDAKKVYETDVQDEKYPSAGSTVDAVEQYIFGGRDIGNRVKNSPMENELYQNYLGVSTGNKNIEPNPMVNPSEFSTGNVKRIKEDQYQLNALKQALFDEGASKSQYQQFNVKPPDDTGGDYDNYMLGTYTARKGQDSQGKYVSYYDKWDLAPMGIPADNIVGKPFDVYGKGYYDITTPTPNRNTLLMNLPVSPVMPYKEGSYELEGRDRWNPTPNRSQIKSVMEFNKGGVLKDNDMKKYQTFAGGGVLEDGLTPQQRKLLESLPVTDPTADNGFRFYEQGNATLPPAKYDSTFGVPQLSPANPGISPIARMNSPNSLTGTTGGYNALSGITPSSIKVDPKAAFSIPSNGFVDSREPVSLDANLLNGISSGVKALVSAAGASKKTPKYRPNEAFTNYMRNLINESQQGFSATQSGAIQQGIDNNFVNESERVRQLTSNGGTAASALAGMSSASQNRNAAGLSKELQDAQLKMQKQAQLGSILSGQEAQNRLLYQQDIARLENQRGAYINSLVQNLDQINQQYSPEGKLSDQYTEMLFKRAKEMMDSSSTSNNAAIFSLFS